MVMDTMDTMARDPLMLMPSQLPLLSQDMDTMDMVMVMDTMDTMARDPLMLMPSQLPLLSQDMDTMAMDMVMDMDTVMAMVDTDTTMARELPMLSQAMDTMDMVMDMDTAMATMDTATDTDMDTTDKQLKSFLLSSLEFSTKNEIGPFGTSHFQTFPKLSINYFLY